MLTIGGAVIGVITWIYASSLVVNGTLDQTYIYWWFPNQFAVFCIGIVMFFILKKSMFDDNGWITKLTLAKKQYISIGCILISIVAGYLLLDRVSTPVGQYALSGAFVLFTIGLAVYPFKAIVNKYSIYLGKISYSCYIVHFAVISALYAVLQLIISTSDFNKIPEVYTVPVFILLFILVVCVTIIIFNYIYKYIEVPGIALGKRLMRK
jgi:peptidoglycan/LPS O-acetylase OafA/YrhL